MPAARGVKRTASKSSASTASTATKNKKKRGAIQLEIPTAPSKRGRVFTCGQGDVGQLGLGEDVEETTKFKFVSVLGDKIVDVYAGGMHTIALDCYGKVWTFGCNDEGALGRVTSGEKDEGTPKSVSLPSKAVAVTAGDSHSAALLDNGDVYAWGAFRDSHGSMGLVMRGREGKSCREPVKVDIGEQAAAIASGGDHLVILSVSGFVYTMGCGEQGQLGRLAQRSANRDARQGFSALLVPSKVTLKGGASRIWAGYHATFVLDANADKMFAWGLNNYGQLGITGEKRKKALYAPTECDAFNRTANDIGAEDGVAVWKRVACGQHHSIALDYKGQVYAVGRCEYGRLGLGDRTGDAESLEAIPKLQNKKCISIAAGTSNSFAVTDSGEAVAWGMGSEGQLGTGARADCAEPAPALADAFPRAPPLHVSAGGQHTVLLVEDPDAQMDTSPIPEPETAEQKEETPADDEEGEDEEDSPQPAKRHKHNEREQTPVKEPAADTEHTQKVNGDENKDTEMEVDENDATTTDSGDADSVTKPDADTPAEASEPAEPEPKPQPEPAREPETSPEKTETPETQENSKDSENTEKNQETKQDRQEHTPEISTTA